MKKAIIILELFVVSSLLACNSAADKNVNNQQNQIASSPPNEIVADITKTFQGTINNKYEITMTLTIKSTVVTGSYKYKTQTNSLNLKGTIDANRNLNLNEFNDKGSLTGIFRGKLINSNISGTWEKPDGSKSFAFNVNEATKSANGNIASSTEPVWTGNYADELGRVLKISDPGAHGGIDFEIHIADENCQEGLYAGTVYLTSPTVAFSSEILDGSVQLTLDENNITLVESNVTHGARCNAQGTYKRKK